MKTKTITIDQTTNISLNKYLYFLIQILALILLPLTIQNKFITGTLVNAILISSSLKNKKIAIFFSFLPSSFALLSGLLNSSLNILIPFIIISNIIIILSFYFLKSKKTFTSFSYFLPALLKANFLFISLLFIKKPLNFSLSFCFAQFITAFLGINLAVFLHKTWKI